MLSHQYHTVCKQPNFEKPAESKRIYAEIKSSKIRMNTFTNVPHMNPYPDDFNCNSQHFLTYVKKNNKKNLKNILLPSVILELCFQSVQILSEFTLLTLG